MGLGCLLTLAWALAGCASAPERDTRLKDLLPTDVLLLGEQHDAPAHQARQRAVLSALQERDQLAALVIEMAERGRSTAGLPRDTRATQVRQALHWPTSQAAGWDWTVYGPLVMRAVQAGVPVLGGNWPRAELRRAMQDGAMDTRLKPAAWTALQALVREGHCALLPESQVVPMARAQVARDLAMARTVTAAVRTGQVVLLVAGNQHVRRDLGVPQHLGPEVRAKSVLMASGEPADADGAPAADQVWHTEALPERDHCAAFRTRLKQR
jgi:uncharacterized iron-regulated protein